MRLIDGDALEKALEDTIVPHRLIGLIRRQPTIEPKDCKKCKSHMAFLMAKMAYDDRRVEPRHGRWIEDEKGAKVTAYKCSECGRVVWDDTGYDVSKDYPYCHCGAKMDEVEECQQETK